MRSPSPVPCSPPPAPHNDNEVLVRAEGVSKKFCRDLKKSLWYGMKDVASELLPFAKQRSDIRDRRSNPSDPSSLTSDPGLRPGEFWANKDISFELRRGECLGLIGHNGAGKTTLLRMLNGLIKPDAGWIEMRGRVGALIALGAGFNPILTGRENIYVNGSVLGLTKQEIDSRIDDIIDFAEIPDAIDAPVQTYSSGMQVRLGFAVATAMQPDILILDEVLAVGDASFRAKCLVRLSRILPTSCVIFVSHNDQQIRHICDQVLLLRNGRKGYEGDVSEGLEIYHRLRTEGAGDASAAAPKWQFDPEYIREIIVDVQIDKKSDRHQAAFVLTIDTPQSFEIGYARAALCSTGEQIECFMVSEETTTVPAGRSSWRLEAWPVDLSSGTYSVNIFLSDKSRKRVFAHGVHTVRFHLESSDYLGCSYSIPSKLLPCA